MTPTVRILDLSGGAEDGIVEEIAGFIDTDHANAFARAYVRDSIETCREAGGDVLSVWNEFGEDAEVRGAADDAWSSTGELAYFAEIPAEPDERDWRSLDPRRMTP